jgi:hypothetical protein
VSIKNKAMKSTSNGHTDKNVECTVRSVLWEKRLNWQLDWLNRENSGSFPWEKVLVTLDF